MTSNSQPKKPEWFELTDGDAPSAQVTKVNKNLPAVAVLVTGAIFATGAFFANASNSESGTSQSAAPSINQVDNQTSGNSGTTAEITNPNPAAPTTSSGVKSHTTTGIKDPTQGGVKAPSGDLEDGDDDHERGEGRERGDHKERENDKNA